MVTLCDPAGVRGLPLGARRATDTDGPAAGALTTICDISSCISGVKEVGSCLGIGARRARGGRLEGGADCARAMCGVAKPCMADI